MLQVRVLVYSCCLPFLFYSRQHATAPPPGPMEILLPLHSLWRLCPALKRVARYRPAVCERRAKGGTAPPMAALVGMSRREAGLACTGVAHCVDRSRRLPWGSRLRRLRGSCAQRDVGSARFRRLYSQHHPLKLPTLQTAAVTGDRIESASNWWWHLCLHRSTLAHLCQAMTMSLGFWLTRFWWSRTKGDLRAIFQIV